MSSSYFQYIGVLLFGVTCVLFAGGTLGQVQTLTIEDFKSVQFLLLTVRLTL